MAFTAKLTKRASLGGSGAAGGGEGWGMGFFLVFFPQEHHHHHQQQQDLINSSSPLKSPTINALLRRTNYTHINAKAQSTISICALLIFLTLFLFTISTFEPNNNNFIRSSHHYRRHLSQSHPAKTPTSDSHALQRLGTLYSRGTSPMNDVVICHVTESVTFTELRTFLRAFHRSGLLTKSDLVFIFPTVTTPDSSDDIIREENRTFQKLIRRYKTELSNGSNLSDFPASFEVAQFMKSGKKDLGKGEPIWGRKIKSNSNSNSSNGGETELTRLSYGSVVGFGVGELDPENSLSGFLDHVPMSLRRWAAYPMILGRLRRNFKHVMLVDVKEVLLLGDPLGPVRNRIPESVYLSATPPPPTTKHNRKVSDKTHQKTINPAVIMGGARGVRRFSAAMLTEIVRATTQQQHSKKKTPVTESALLSRLATNDFLQKSIHLVASTESLPEASSLSGVLVANTTVVRRGNSNIDIDYTKHICSYSIEGSVYSECANVQSF
ncbi:hypothetical protein LXL04_036254 [Taraxacum kok-saghyz]